jgi:hypothetical protein
MKKIFQIGFVVALAALLPTGVVFAGDGDGKGKKNQVTVMPDQDKGSGSVTLIVNTKDAINMDDVHVATRNSGSYIKEVNPVLGGLEVIIGMDPETFYSNPDNDGGIIIEIVGVDNITGVDATDGNNGTSVPTGFTTIDEDPGTADGVQNNPTGIHGQSGTNYSNAGGTSGGVVNVSPTTSFKDITVFPNPVMDQTNVVTVGEILGRTIQIMDLSGHIVLTTGVAKGSRQTVLDLSMLKPGVYVLMYQTEGGQTISKRIQKI